MNLILSVLYAMVLTLFSIHAYPQEQIILNGQVLDSKTNLPIPYAHVGVVNTTTGTVTNTSGFFTLAVPHQYHNHLLTITSIGYIKQHIKIGSIAKKNLKIKLHEEITQLNEVVITEVEKDIALELVKYAIERIPENYPDKPEILNGFYREVVLYNDNIEYVIESKLDIYKSSYEKPVKKGDVRAIKGRTYESNKSEKSNILFHSGPHIPHRFDFAMRREGPLDLKKIDNYDYTIVDTIEYQNQAVIIVSFQPQEDKSAKGRGLLFIGSKSKAFVRGEFNFNGEEVAFTEKIGSVTSGYKRLNIKYVADYKEYDNEWRLNFIQYKTEFLTPLGDTLMANDIFSVSNIKADPDKIPYNNQIQYGDVFLENIGEYDADFWKNYVIVVPEKEIEELFRNAKRKEEIKRAGFRDYLKKVRGSLGFFVSQAEVFPHLINYSNNGFLLKKKIIQREYFYYGLNSSVTYELTPRFLVGYEIKESLGQNKHSTFTLKLGWQKAFNLGGRPAYLVPSLNVGYYRYRYFLDSFESSADLTIRNREFDSESIAVSLESRRIAMEPLIKVAFERSHKVNFFVEAGWVVALKNWDGLYFKEEKGFHFGRKGTFLNESDPDLIFSEEDNKSHRIQIDNSLTVNIGITLSL